MTFSPSEACAALGLTPEQAQNPSLIDQAFEKLTRRYPPSHFPERFASILAARDTLRNLEQPWRELLEARTLNLAWLRPHLASAVDSTEGLQEAMQDAATYRQSLLRAAFTASDSLDDMDQSDIDDDFDDDQVMPDLDLAEVESLLKKLMKM